MNTMIRWMIITICLLVGYTLKTELIPNERFVTAVNKSMPAVVDIKVTVTRLNSFTGEYQKGVVTGAGVYVTSNGYILTCGHLFNFPNIEGIVVMDSQGNEIAGKLVDVDFETDLALIRTTFNQENEYVKLADPSAIRVGQEVIAIGSPLGFSFTVTNGIVSRLYVDVGDRLGVLQSNTIVNPGNSGGPLLNLQGELVGIVSFLVSGSRLEPVFTGLGFSVSPSQCQQFLIDNRIIDEPIEGGLWLRQLLQSGLGILQLEV